MGNAVGAIGMVIGEVILGKRLSHGKVEGQVVILARSHRPQALTEDVRGVHWRRRRRGKVPGLGKEG